MFLRSLTVFCVSILSLLTPASADPVRVQDVTALLREHEVQNVSNAILYGQPIVSGQMKRLSFRMGLRNCARQSTSEDLYCTEVAFKTCVVLEPTEDRVSMLEVTNAYNLSRRLGYVTLDGNERLGAMLCVQSTTFFEDENILDFDEVLLWEQTVDDFRTFLIEEEIELFDMSLL